MIVPLVMVEYLKRKINSPSSLGQKVGLYNTLIGWKLYVTVTETCFHLILYHILWVRPRFSLRTVPCLKVATWLRGSSSLTRQPVFYHSRNPTVSPGLSAVLFFFSGLLVNWGGDFFWAGGEAGVCAVAVSWDEDVLWSGSEMANLAANRHACV